MERTGATQLAVSLMEQHGLFARGWSFDYDRAKRRFGQCNYTRKVISLSWPLVELNNEQQVRDTVLHEIAHALTQGAGHGLVWRVQARAIGCTAMRCASSADVVVPEMPMRWVGRCPAGHERRAHRMPRRMRSCGTCCPGVWNPAHLIVWTREGGK